MEKIVERHQVYYEPYDFYTFHFVFNNFDDNNI